MMIIEFVLSSHVSSGIDIVCSNKLLADLGYANEDVQLNEGPRKLPTSLDHLNDKVAIVWVCAFKIFNMQNAVPELDRGTIE